MAALPPGMVSGWRRSTARPATFGWACWASRPAARRPTWPPTNKRSPRLLIERAQEALEDRYLQENVFDTLRRILPDIERLQRWQDATRYAGRRPWRVIEDSPVYSPEFQQWVKDALSHYWGGPKLTESPCLALRIVQDEIREAGRQSLPRPALGAEPGHRARCAPRASAR